MKIINRIKEKITNWMVTKVCTDEGFWELVEIQMMQYVRECKADNTTEISAIKENLEDLNNWQAEIEEAFAELESRVHDLETAATVDERKINHMGERLDNFWEELNEHYHNIFELQNQMEEYDTRADDQESEISEIQEKLEMLDDRTPPWDEYGDIDLEKEVQSIKELMRDIASTIRGSSIY